MADPGGLRLLVVGAAWPPETFIARLLQGLAQAGIQVTLAAARKPAGEWLSQPNLRWLFTPSWERPAVERALHLFTQAAGAARRGGKDLRTLSSQLRRLKSRRERLAEWQRLLPFAGRRWDVIYFPWNSAAIEYLPLFDLGMPAVISCRGSQINVAPHNPQRGALRHGLRQTFEKAEAVHCVSHAILREAAGYGLDPRKARVIYPAVDVEFFTPLAAGEREARSFHIVTTGSLIWRKGYEYALMAMRRLKDRGVPVDFEIIGSGPERQRLLYTIDDLGLQDCARLAGRLPPETVRQRLQQADAFLLSSLSEGLSNAALEAMACGLPVVTTDVGGMGEAIRDGVEGLLTPPRDPAALAEALERLWRDPALRARLGAAGRGRVLRDFSLPAQVAQFVELFNSL
jgi:colanic acid/amylovoran biosynthesis glycosyltransferase